MSRGLTVRRLCPPVPRRASPRVAASDAPTDPPFLLPACLATRAPRSLRLQPADTEGVAAHPDAAAGHPAVRAGWSGVHSVWRGRRQRVEPGGRGGERRLRRRALLPLRMRRGADVAAQRLQPVRGQPRRDRADGGADQRVLQADELLPEPPALRALALRPPADGRHRHARGD